MSDNKWFKKEAPLQSLTGLWGGLASNLTSGSGGSAWTHGIEMWGGGGGAGIVAGSGGAGGYAKINVNLPSGTYYATAGAAGYVGDHAGARQRSSGGPGLRQQNTNEGASAGGFSAIWTNNTYTGDPLFLVGGGGGSDWGDQGGNGGGVNTNGGTGWDRINGGTEYSPSARPIGATLTAGGYYNHGHSGGGCNGEAGVQLRGGDSTCTQDNWSGGGGGGGYWGGGAGTGNVGQGGTPGSGGSGKIGVGGAFTYEIDTNTTDAQRLQTFSSSGSTYYQPDNPGTDGGGGAANNDGQPGRVKIYSGGFDAGTPSVLHNIAGPATNTSFTV